MGHNDMDSNDSDIVILRDFIGKKGTKDLTELSSQHNDSRCKDGPEDPCGIEDEIDEVPDFDDAELEVLDCWEDDEEINEDKLKGHEGIEGTSSQKKDCNATKGSNPEAAFAKKNSRSSNDSSDKKGLLKDSSHPNAAKTTDLSNKNDSKNSPKSSRSSSKRKSSPVSDSRSTKATEPKKSFNKSTDSKREPHSSSSRRTPKRSRHEKRPSDLPSDPTETKVDKFLKEIARQHPKIIGLQDDFDDKALEPVSSDSSKHSSQGPLALINSLDLPPGVDTEQVCEDTSTSHLLLTSKLKDVGQSQSSIQASAGDSFPKDSSLKPWLGRSGDVGTCSKSRVSGHIRSDVSKGSDGDREKRSRSPHSKYHYTNHSKRISRSPPSKVRRVSPAKSFSISPLPSPRSHQPARSPLLPNPSPLLPTPRIPPLIDFGYSSTSAGPMYVDRHSYQPPLLERKRYQRSRSPVHDSSPLRELSRSMSRERACWSQSRSRSRSRGRHSAQSRSRSRHQYSSHDDQHRRYRRSISRIRSGVQRSRSRSRSQSWSPPRYRKRSPLRDERCKRLCLPRSRSRSPWKQHTEIASTEWHSNYQDLNHSLPVKDDVQLEHVMERFIQTNMAATGLIPPPAPDVRGWLDQDIKEQESLPGAQPEINLGGMPLPPPPPDISELMSGEEIKEASALRAMTPEVSLSSILESAVTGCPEKVIIERCQDAIMKLHDVSIKPGRFAVISSIKVPQTELSSAFRPWQSVLNRSVGSKIQLNYSKPTEKPLLWGPHNSKLSQTNQTKNAPSSCKEAAPVGLSSINTSAIVDAFNYESDRAVLLDRIMCLTKELERVKQTLNRHLGQQKHIAVQTLPVVLCEICGNNLSLPSLTSCRQSQVDPSASASTSGFWASASSHNPRKGLYPSAVSKAKPASNQLPTNKPALQQVPLAKPAAKQVPASKQVAKQGSVPKAVPTSKQLPVAQPVPAAQQHPVPVPVPTSTSLPSSYSKPHNSSLIGSKVIAQETNNAIGSSNSLSNQPSVSYPSQQSSSKITASSASQNSRPCAVGGKAGVNVPVNTAQSSNGVPQHSGTGPQSTKTIPPLLSLAPRPISKQMSTPSRNLMSAGDFDLSKYSMLGDEHMFDLIAHLRSIGIQVNLHAKFCSTGQSVDSIQKNLLGVQVPKQIILMLGLYNQNFNDKLIVKFKHLIGFCRKRCSHLVLIEPPPIPKWEGAKHAWKTFTELKASFGPFQAENVSVVYIGERLLVNPTTPNPAFYVNNQRLSHEGLCIVTEELQKALGNAKIRVC